MRYHAILFLTCLLGAGMALAQSASIEQLASGSVERHHASEASDVQSPATPDLRAGVNAEKPDPLAPDKPDYQQYILNQPITDYGRAQAVIGSEGKASGAPASNTLLQDEIKNQKE